MSVLQGKFVWFEHLSNDIPAARRFYEQLFGWHTETMPMGAQSYSMILNGADGIAGYSKAPRGVPSNWLSYVSVADVDATHRAAVAAGAKSQMGPMDMGDVGRGAVVTDPTGATVAIWKGAQGDRPDVPMAPVGAFCWNELWTGDEKKALAFYESVFGYTHGSMDMGPQGTYYMLESGGQQRAGLMRSSEPSQLPMWLPYVHVADTDASAAKAQSLGAQIVVPPTDIPNIGRFSVLIDPLGAGLAMIKLSPGG